MNSILISTTWVYLTFVSVVLVSVETVGEEKLVVKRTTDTGKKVPFTRTKVNRGKVNRGIGGRFGINRLLLNSVPLEDGNKSSDQNQGAAR